MAASSSSTKNCYGAVDANSEKPNDGITIIKQKQTAKDYSPQYGVPKVGGGYFQNPSTSRSEETSKSESGYEGASGSNIKKSDSAASDWLSTPTDEMIGIDVKGIENDRINYRNSDPRV